jgi:CRP-like cAMP-binding protein
VSQPRLEDFRPRLHDNVERFVLPNGDVGLYRAGRYLHVPEPLIPLADAAANGDSLATAMDQAARAGRPMSVGRMLRLARTLGQGGWLQNAPAELQVLGVSREAAHWRVAFEAALSPALAAPWLARFVAALARPLGRVLPQTRALALVTLVALGVLLACQAAWAESLPPDPLNLRGAHRYGLLAVAAGIALALSARCAVRAAVTSAAGYAIARAGLRFYGLVGVAPYIDARHNFRGGRRQELRLAAASCAAVLLTPASLALASVWAFAAAHLLALAATGGVAVAFMTLCPFAAGSDLGRVIDHGMPGSDGRRHAFAYLRVRFLRLQGGGVLFDGEVHHLLACCACILWLYWAAVWPLRWISTGLLPAWSVLRTSASGPDSVLMILIMVALSVAVVAAAGLAVVGTLLFAWGHMPRRASRGKQTTADADIPTLLSGSPLFASMREDALQRLALGTRVLLFARGSTIIRQGDAGHCFFILARGDALVSLQLPSGVTEPLATLHEGDGFGEVALVEDTPRTASVSAVSDVVAVVIEREAFVAALTDAGLDRERTTALLRAAHALRSADAFRHLSPTSVTDLLARCSREVRAAGDVLIEEGGTGDRFYVIEDGQVRVTQGGEELAMLGPGHYFGEMALLTDEPRKATVTCASATRVLSLDRAGFRNVMNHDFHAAMRLEQTMRQRGSVAP